MLPFFFSPYCLIFRIVIPGTHPLTIGALDVMAGSDAKLSVALVVETLVGNDSYELNMGDFHKAQQEFQEQISSHTRELLKAKFPAIAAADVHFLRGKGRWGDQAFGGCSHDGSGRDR